ncbi:MAG: hypothetical protein IT437_01525 [Phycisphaerales bacterium]|nr:hypothetical protein [Phycisphaerales bacterium]
MAKKRRRRSIRGLSRVSTADLRAELTRRESGLAKERDRLLLQLVEIEGQMGGRRGPGRPRGRRGPGRPRGRRPGARRRGRPPGRSRNPNSLVASLKALLTDKTMGVTEAAAAVQKAGYKTTSPNFRTIVNQALIASGNFRRVSRGQYTAK